MKTTTKTNTVRFMRRGQIVIPRWVRREFAIEDGARAIVSATPEGILLRPITAVTIRRLRGILKRKPDDKPLAQAWAEHKRDEKDLEERKYVRSTGSR